MENVIINGEIYIKKGPSLFDSSFYDDFISEKEFEASKEGASTSDMAKLEQYKEVQEMAHALDGALDYSYTNDFHILNYNGEEYLMYNHTRLLGGHIHNKYFTSLYELKKEYISLIDFMNKATFIGRRFNRTKPVENDDRSFMNSDINRMPIALYGSLDLLIVIDPYDNGIRIINSRYLQDKNFEFVGDEIYLEYKDKGKLYKAILTQILQDEIQKSKHDPKRKSEEDERKRRR